MPFRIFKTPKHTSPIFKSYKKYLQILEFLRIRPPMYSPPPEKEPSPDDNLYEDPDKNQPRRRQSSKLYKDIFL